MHDIQPATAVVSLVTPGDMTSVRSAFCNHVDFFASPDAAPDWLAEHPGMSVLPVADAYQLGHPLTQRLLDARDPGHRSSGRGCKNNGVTVLSGRYTCD
ncbi:hypothetical protein GTS_51680 [Gandjariella thermophila]|uniref:Ig-like domain-containing protein n=1 Tax=Gandjariella thermophila TaxID=1931992 RepID=A0A4D4J9P1_9PSEU|nr:hypothetical protein GTS_51680 [Gandjariella thermophila]